MHVFEMCYPAEKPPITIHQPSLVFFPCYAGRIISINSEEYEFALIHCAEQCRLLSSY